MNKSKQFGKEPPFFIRNQWKTSASAMRLEHFLISRASSHFHLIKSLIGDKIHLQSVNTQIFKIISWNSSKQDLDEIKIANEPNGRRSDSFIEKITRLVILSRFNQQERIETIWKCIM